VTAGTFPQVAPLPWPFMGCDYHYIHHKYNWYNFGFMTLGFDTLFGTVKHPQPSALALSRGELPMPNAELRKSAALSEALLRQRGAADALAADAARGGESGEHFVSDSDSSQSQRGAARQRIS